MKRKQIFATVILVSAGLVLPLTSCSRSKKNRRALPELTPAQKNHVWYYFTDTSFSTIDLPQHAPETLEKPWTEAVRISSAARNYALINRLGIISFTPTEINLYTDSSIFSDVTAEQLVFSGGRPVFYLYRSTFFNRSLERGTVKNIQPSRPFLVEFNPLSRVFFPLVTYNNLHLSDDDQITGYFWDGKSWMCSSKRTTESRVEFSYFYWEPSVDLTELSPALSSQDMFTFRSSTEEEYYEQNLPRSFSKAPEELQDLLASIPSDLGFSVSWRGSEGTSPLQFFQQGGENSLVTARAALDKASGYIAAVFEDGTTYVKRLPGSEKASDSGVLQADLVRKAEHSVCAFKLPLLPAGYIYGDFALSGNTLYVAWEESSFYKTGRSGFLSVDLKGVLERFLQE